jgi:T5SS/PEP-CTERM-associated repeat protein
VPRLIRLLAAALLLAAATPAAATNYTWVAVGNGTFQGTTVWSPTAPAGGPTGADGVTFGVPNTYTVSFAANAVSAAFTQPRGTVTLGIGAGHTYTVLADDGFAVGSAGGQTANLTVTSGTLQLGGVNWGGPAGVGGVAGAVGNLTVTGPTAALNAAWHLSVGGDGTGTLTVQNGASATFANPLILGSETTAQGTVTVGAGSTVTAQGGVSVGYSGAGTLTVAAGGTLNSGFFGGVGPYNGSTGTASVSGTWNHGADLGIGGADLGPGGTGDLTVYAGGALTVTGGHGITTFAGRGTLTLDGGTVTTTSLTNNGTLNLIGGSLVIDGGTFTNGGAALPFYGTLTLRNGATASNLGAVSVGGNGPGTLTVTGAGSTLTAVGAITVGTAAGGAGTLTIDPGTRVAGGTLVLNPAGAVRLNGGTLSVAGIAPLGGTFTVPLGTVAFTGGWTADGPQVATVLGPTAAIGPGRTVQVASVTALQVPLALTGGTFTTGALTGGTLLQLNTGTFNLTGTPLAVGPGGTLGTGPLTVGPGLTVSAATVTVAAGGVAAVAGGSLTGTGGVTNAGDIALSGPAAVLGGPLLTNAGRLSGTGRVTADLTNAANGRISADVGQRLVFAGTTSTNAANATVELTGGTVEFTGKLTNSAGGQISGHGTFRGSSMNTTGVGLDNFGVVAFSGGASDVFGKVNNLGGATGGQIVNAGGGVLTFHDDVVNNGAEIRTAAGGRAVFLGAVSGAASFTGVGTVEQDGDLRPGNSPARVTYGGDLILGGSADLHIELGGTTAGSQYDQLAVAGTAYLCGGLDVQLLNGFVPQPGDRFDVLTYGSRVGDFATFAGLNLGGGYALTPAVTGTTYSLVVTPVPEPGGLALLAVPAAVGWVTFWRRRWRTVDSGIGGVG